MMSSYKRRGVMTGRLGFVLCEKALVEPGVALRGSPSWTQSRGGQQNQVSFPTGIPVRPATTDAWECRTRTRQGRPVSCDDAPRAGIGREAHSQSGRLTKGVFSRIGKRTSDVLAFFGQPVRGRGGCFWMAMWCCCRIGSAGSDAVLLLGCLPDKVDARAQGLSGESTGNRQACLLGRGKENCRRFAVINF